MFYRVVVKSEKTGQEGKTKTVRAEILFLRDTNTEGVVPFTDQSLKSYLANPTNLGSVRILDDDDKSYVQVRILGYGGK